MMSNIMSQIFRFILKLVLGLSAAIFAFSLLVATLVVLVLGLLKSWVTGRKPAAVMLFEHVQQFRSQRMWSGHKNHSSSRGGQAGHVVDVEMREIRDEKRLS
jgi:hypothetical protein